MTDPSKAQSRANHGSALLPQKRARRLLQTLVVLAAVTLTGTSLAASPPPRKVQAPTPHHAAQRPAAHPTTSAPKSKHAQAPQQAQRKTPGKARIAAKSKAATRAHQSPRTPAKLATKKTKHVA
jgi:hypothetical protein